MKLKVNIGKRVKEYQKRIARLPVYLNPVVKSKLKRHALQFIRNFHDGIKFKQFVLKKLKDETIVRKKQMEYLKPDVPLYAKGDERKDDSYVNMMRIRELKNGWKVYPSWKKHWNAKIQLRKLFMVHEYGAILSRKDGALIRIPARPAAFKAYDKTIRELTKDTSAKMISSAAKKYVRDGNDARLKTIVIDMTKPYKKEEKFAKGN